MQCVTRPRITELNPHLLCVLCGGYYIDATAIIECLHSFCRSCIVRYLETHKYCPICDVLVHKTKPLQNLRPDTILQSIVYKLVPNLYEKEMRNRRNYYMQVHPSLHPQNQEEKGEITELSIFFCSTDTINFTLEYINHTDDPSDHNEVSKNLRYFQCQGTVSIGHLRKLIQAKYTLRVKHEVHFFYNEVQLPEYLTLLDIAYISSWKRRGFIRLLYRILEVKKIQKEEKLELPPSTETNAVTPPPTQPQNEIPAQAATEMEISIDTVDPENVTQDIKDQSQLSTSSTSPDPHSLVIDETATVTKPLPLSSCDTSTDISTSALSITVTSSINSDDIFVSCVDTPITTSSCEINSSLPEKMDISETTETINHKQLKPEKESTKNDIANETPEKSSDDSKPASNCKLSDDSKPFDDSKLSDNSKLSDDSKPSGDPKPSNDPKPSKNDPKPFKNDPKPSKNDPKLSNNLKPSNDSKKIDDPKPAPKKPENKLEKCQIPSIRTKRPLDTAASEVKEATEKKKATNTSDASPSLPKMPKLLKLVPKEKSASRMPIKSTLEVKTTSSAITSTNTSSASTSESIKYTTPSISLLSSLKTTSKSKTDCVQRDFPRPIFTRSEVPTITKSTTKIIKTFNRPWNSSQPGTSSVTNNADQKDQSKPMKIIKARSTPRYLGNPSSRIRPMYQVTPSIVPSIKPLELEEAKKPAKNLSVMKIDPNTLSPIGSTATTSSVAATSSSSPKKSYPYLPGSSELYTSSEPFASSSLATYTSSPNLTSKPGSFLLPNPLLPMNQLMYEIYGNGPRTLEYMKTMTSNFCGSSMFHPALHAPLSSFYSSLQKNAKYEKSRGIKTFDKSPPAIQRIPPSNNNNNAKPAVNEHSSEKKNSPGKSDNVMNGQLKSKNKKSSEASSFSINNLIPMEMAKHASHSCSADGVNQICDQMSPNRGKNKKNAEEIGASTEKTTVEAKTNDSKKD